MTTGRSGRRSAPWLLLIAAALMLRALVPQGMMLQHGEGEGFALALCPSDQTFAPLLAHAAATGERHSGHDHSLHAGTGHAAGDDFAPDPQGGASGEPHTKPCTFSAHNSDALAPDIPDLSLPRAAEARHDAIRERTLQPSRPRVAPPARAPPVPA